VDAYAFATSATSGAHDTLAGMVGTVLRVTIPLDGPDFAAYAAAAAGTVPDLQQKMADVQGVTGLQGVETYVAAQAHNGITAPTLSSTPTWVSPQDTVGFAMIETDQGTDAVTLYSLVRGVTGVIGVATLGPTTVLAEVTGATVSACNAVFTAIEAVDGVGSMRTATGSASAGTGVPGH
jgi:hypothetical protein